MAHIAFSATLAALLMLVFGRWGISQLRRLDLHQRIRDEAPPQHRGKAGTPTMGGLLILAAVVLTVAAAIRPVTASVLLALVATVGYAAVGAADDVLAISRQRNLGLRARERLAVQIPLAVGIGLYVMRRSDLGAGLSLPWGGRVDLGWLYLLFAVVYLVGFVNAVNLTDGLDGLAGGTVAIAAGTYAVIAWRLGKPEAAALAAAVGGACAGFVWFNAHPAAVIMGDVGSNALGAALAAVAIITKTELTLLAVGIVFVLEAASVLGQVAYFKAAGGRRLLRMSPLHHHFELVGWTEPQTVVRFWLLGALGALLGLATVF